MRVSGFVTDRGGIADTVAGAGSAATVLADAEIATIAAGSLPAGTYELRVWAAVSGVAVGDMANMELRRGAPDLVSPIPVGTDGAPVELLLPRVALTGAQALTVNAIGNGTAAVEYAATIVATRVE